MAITGAAFLVTGEVTMLAALRVRSVKLVLSMLQIDITRLPVTSIIRYLNAALAMNGDDHQIRQLVLQTATAAISVTHDPDEQAQLAQIAGKCDN